MTIDPRLVGAIAIGIAGGLAFAIMTSRSLTATPAFLLVAFLMTFVAYNILRRNEVQAE